MNRRPLAALALAAALLPAIAAAQLIKCAGPDGRVTYSDRSCQAGEKRAEVKAGPIPEPTAQDAQEAELRRIAANEQARQVERRRAAERPARAIGIYSTPTRGRSVAAMGPGADADRCYGVRRQIRIAKRLNPIGYEREFATTELQRAERQFCDN